MSREKETEGAWPLGIEVEKHNEKFLSRPRHMFLPKKKRKRVSIVGTDTYRMERDFYRFFYLL
jgi:hypothetical protein